MPLDRRAIVRVTESTDLVCCTRKRASLSFFHTGESWVPQVLVIAARKLSKDLAKMMEKLWPISGWGLEPGAESTQNPRGVSNYFVPFLTSQVVGFATSMYGKGLCFYSGHFCRSWRQCGSSRSRTWYCLLLCRSGM